MTPSTEWKDEIPAGEAEHLEELARQLEVVRRKDSTGRALRTLHAKSHVGVRAELTVRADLPEHARVGIFAQPGTWQGWARYSNASAAPHRDQAPDLRGFVFKILGVPGRKLIPGLEDATTQDFLMINTPSQAFRNVDEFVFFVVAGQNPSTLLPKAIWRLGFARTFQIIRAFQAAGRSVPSLAGRRFWSTAPIQWGRFAAKYSALPVAGNDAARSIPEPRNFLADDLIERLSKAPLEYDFAAQFYVDPVRTPLDDVSVEWTEEVSPFVRLARLTIPQQDLRSEAGRRQQEYVESLSFDPWHAPVEFRPLSAIQRARNHAYRISTQARGAAPEPKGTESALPLATGS
jgi:hypothetical protein